uniref:Secreted protein n=1 Tax=Physcomitrium patens TaxID=3218 RepID=A0A2K1K7U8_PHYPA|nr:hypothetical protein PHYPA_011743 [Physcomitrium patens]
MPLNLITYLIPVFFLFELGPKTALFRTVWAPRKPDAPSLAAVVDFSAIYQRAPVQFLLLQSKRLQPVQLQRFFLLQLQLFVAIAALPPPPSVAKLGDDVLLLVGSSARDK